MERQRYIDVLAKLAIADRSNALRLAQTTSGPIKVLLLSHIGRELAKELAKSVGSGGGTAAR
jgi:hypothetical protein